MQPVPTLRRIARSEWPCCSAARRNEVQDRRCGAKLSPGPDKKRGASCAPESVLRETFVCCSLEIDLCAHFEDARVDVGFRIERSAVELRRVRPDVVGLQLPVRAEVPVGADGP